MLNATNYFFGVKRNLFIYRGCIWKKILRFKNEYNSYQSKDDDLERLY